MTLDPSTVEPTMASVPGDRGFVLLGDPSWKASQGNEIFMCLSCISHRHDGAAVRAGPPLLGMHPSLAPQGVRVRGPTVEGIAEAVLLADLPLMEQRWVREMAYYHGQMASVRDGHEYFPGHV